MILQEPLNHVFQEGKAEVSQDTVIREQNGWSKEDKYLLLPVSKAGMGRSHQVSVQQVRLVRGGEVHSAECGAQKSPVLREHGGLAGPAFCQREDHIISCRTFSLSSDLIFYIYF